MISTTVEQYIDKNDIIIPFVTFLKKKLYLNFSFMRRNLYLQVKES